MAAHFASFPVESQVFYRTALTLGLVNLKPILPGHVLLIPRRVVPRLADLTAAELADLAGGVQRVSAGLRRAFHASGTTVSLQDGPSAGQSVPHVHFHLLPRASGDLERNDDVYARLDDASARLATDWQAALAARPPFTAVDDADRHPRTEAEMVAEARWLATFFGADEAGPGESD